jgi:hypothetical protein
MGREQLTDHKHIVHLSKCVMSHTYQNLMASRIPCFYPIMLFYNVQAYAQLNTTHLWYYCYLSQLFSSHHYTLLLKVYVMQKTHFQ